MPYALLLRSSVQIACARLNCAVVCLAASLPLSLAVYLPLYMSVSLSICLSPSLVYLPNSLSPFCRVICLEFCHFHSYKSHFIQFSSGFAACLVSCSFYCSCSSFVSILVSVAIFMSPSCCLLSAYAFFRTLLLPCRRRC